MKHRWHHPYKGGTILECVVCKTARDDKCSPRSRYWYKGNREPYYADHDPPCVPPGRSIICFRYNTKYIYQRVLGVRLNVDNELIVHTEGGYGIKINNVQWSKLVPA